MALNGYDIIVADDDAEDLLFFEMALNKIKISASIRHAEHGDMLFVLLKEKIPVLLFLDIHMPCKDGISCIKELRQSKDYDHLPVIIYTSDLYKKTIEECYRSGANYYLAKPASINVLAEKLITVLSVDWNETMHYPSLDNFIV